MSLRLAHARMDHTPGWATPSNNSKVFRNKEITGETVVSGLIGSKDFNKRFLFLLI